MYGVPVAAKSPQSLLNSKLFPPSVYLFKKSYSRNIWILWCVFLAFFFIFKIVTYKYRMFTEKNKSFYSQMLKLFFLKLRWPFSDPDDIFRENIGMCVLTQ